MSKKDKAQIALLLFGAMIFEILPWPVVNTIADWSARRS